MTDLSQHDTDFKETTFISVSGISIPDILFHIMSCHIIFFNVDYKTLLLAQSNIPPFYLPKVCKIVKS